MTDLPNPDAKPPTATFLVKPLRDLAAWTRYFRDAEIPVLAETSQALEELRAIEDDVDAGMLNTVIQSDPLMTLKVMAHVASRRRSGVGTEAETITSSLLMMGISPFFKNFGLQPTIEDRLGNEPRALEGLRESLRSAERAGRFAVGFAVHRNDLDAGIIHLAAFLHDFTELLLWCHAPALALQIQDTLRANTKLRTADVQRKVLNITLDDLRQELMSLSHLPELLVRLSNGRHAEQADVRNVVLAVRLARHTMHGWDNAALADDIDDIAKLLNAPPRIALAFVHKLDQPE